LAILIIVSSSGAETKNLPILTQTAHIATAAVHCWTYSTPQR